MILQPADLRRLSSKYGPRFFVVDIDRFRQNWSRFHGAFESAYPHVSIAYSYKTNYLAILCRENEELGGMAEVVSGTERRMADSIGVDPKRVIYNGPVKSTDSLIEALAAGSIVNIDNLAELNRILQIRNSSTAGTFRVGLRCNFSDGSFGTSRFGFSTDSSEFFQAVHSLQATNGIELEGLHVHYCPNERTAEVYGQLADRLITTSNEIFRDCPPAWLNIGGGFCSPMPEELKSRWSFSIPSFEDYGNAVGSRFASSFQGKDRPLLILEPGLALCADVTEFVCRVDSLKRVGPKSIATATGSVYDIRPTKNDANLPLTVVAGDSKGQSGTWQIFGSTCMEDDIMYSDYRGNLGVGDFCVFGNCGAYTFVLRPPFIHPAAPVISLRNSMEHRLELSGQTDESMAVQFGFEKCG